MSSPPVLFPGVLFSINNPSAHKHKWGPPPRGNMRYKRSGFRRKNLPVSVLFAGRLSSSPSDTQNARCVYNPGGKIKKNGPPVVSLNTVPPQSPQEVPPWFPAGVCFSKSTPGTMCRGDKVSPPPC